MAVQFGEPGDLGPLGRVIIWESEEAANHASLFEEVQALRSQVNLAIEDGHTDVIYHVTGDILGA